MFCYLICWGTKSTTLIDNKIIFVMKDPVEQPSNQYDIVIIECCENCETHQNFSRHSQWKYFQQFNELKRKIQKFIPNTIVIKNPVPDELIKTPEIKNQKNLFVNKDSNEKIIYPRIGSFEIYIYNILISSKLLTTQWPNHYKILQTLNRIMEEKKKGNPLNQFSVYNQTEEMGQSEPQSKEMIPFNDSPEKKNVRISSKKKKGPIGLPGKAYKSIDRGQDHLKELKSTLDPLSSKIIIKDDISPSKGKKNVHRYLQSKGDARVKLPSLSNTMANLRDQSRESQKKTSEKKIANTIEQIQQEDLSRIEKKDSQMYESRKFSLLELKSQEMKNNSVSYAKNQELKFFEDHSVQYSEPEGKDLMNRSIQYEEEEGFYCDFGMQIDQENLQKDKEINLQWVQTQRVEFRSEPKIYTLEEQVQANIIVSIPSNTLSTQTIIKQFVDQTLGTDLVMTVNREIQFPEESSKSVNIDEIVDANFQHLYEKRRNILDNEDYFSIDRFQQKSTKYKWIGRANLIDNPEDLKRKMFNQCLVFSVYNYYGIKTPEKRLSYQMCSNVVGQKLKEGLLHILAFDNPELQYVTQFEDFNFSDRRFPLSELITFKASKQSVKFNNYGGFLALAYFLNDFEIFNPQNNQLGFVIVNETVKEIHKLSALNYKIHPQTKSSDQEIIVSLDNNAIKINRLSESVELQFFSMLSRICDQNTFQELIKYVRQIFIHSASTYQQFKMTLLSLHLESSEELVVEDFIKMLQNRVERIKQIFKGKLYTYKKYHSLTPTIKYAIPFEHKIQRRLHFNDKIVNSHDIVKHLRNNNALVIIQGEEGSGKTTLLSEMLRQLKSVQKINAISISWLRKQPLKIKQQMFQLSKNIILVDNAEHFQAEVIDLLDFMGKTSYEYSVCLSTSNFTQKQIIRHRFSQLSIVDTSLLPLTGDEIKDFMMKVVKFNSYTDKKDMIDSLILNPKYIKILQNPFFLSLYSSNLALVDSSSYKPKDSDLSKYSILKQAFSSCTTRHGEEMKEMNLSIKQALPNLRRMAFEYYHNGQETNEVVKDIISTYEQSELIRSQLAYYPVNLDSIVSANYQNLFSHQLFLKFFLIQAYCYFVEKGFRNMKMQKIYNDKFLLDLIAERYKIENTYSQLLEVVLSTKKFKTISEASSNALTLLSKMGYVFSNLNFDDCVIPFADLSNSIFYQCSFRGTDLEEAILYKSQMISCTFDGAAMARINLFSKKYEIQFTAMTCSISVDNRRLAFGCGNYLIILNAETGAQIKRIEAHLDVIRVVKYTRDGNSLVTIADDKTLRIWDVYTYKSVVFKLPQKGSISYSNQTQTIASVNKNALKVWNLKSMANEAELQGHTEAITTIDFSYDGELILTGSKDTTLRLWTLKGRQLNVFKGHDEEIMVGKISPTKRVMISSSKGKDIIMWSIESGTRLVSKKFMSEITEICLDNKEKYILVTFSNDNHIVVLDFLSLDIIHALTGHEAKIMSLHFDHNFKQLVSLGKDRTARVWQFDKIIQNQIRHPKITTKIQKGPVLALAYDKNKLLYATAHENGQLNLWNSEDNSLKDQLMSHNGPVRCLAIDKTSKIYSGGSDGALRIWNLQSKREPRVIEIHSSEMIQLKLSEKNRFIATSSVANQLVIHDFTGIKIVMSTREEGRVYAIAFSHDEKFMAVGGAEKYVAIYEVTNSNSVNRTSQLGQHSDGISAITFFSDFLLVVALKNGQVAIWNHHRSSLIKKIENVSPIKTLMQFQKKYICFSTEDGKIRIVNMDEGKEVRVFRYSETPTALDINEDESLLVVGTNTGNVMKWNLDCVKPPTKKIEFDRKSIDQQCSRIVTVQSGRTLLIKDLFYHREELVEVKVDSDIEGVTIDGDKIIMLLKNGKYWQYGKKQYKFKMTNTQEGDLHSIRDKTMTNFFKSGIKKIKGMCKPSLSILEEINQM